MDPLEQLYSAERRPAALVQDVATEDTADEVSLLVAFALRLLLLALIGAVVWRRRATRLANRLMG